MLVKLTYYSTGNPTIVNLNKIETIYQVVDKHQNRISTKIQFTGGSFVNVEEDLQTILSIQWKMMNGVSQDLDFNSPTIDEMLQQSYEKREKFVKTQPKKYYREENDFFANRY